MKTNYENLFDKVDYLLMSVEKIHKIITKSDSAKAPPKNLSFNGTIEFLKDNGMIISESKLYKLTAKKEIPFCRFNNKLVFNTLELEKWIQTQIARKNDNQLVSINPKYKKVWSQ
ncbi:helix-turn-helix domain-containing protein [Flavobacterium sp.]